MVSSVYLPGTRKQIYNRGASSVDSHRYNHFQIRWVLISLCVPMIGLYQNSDKKIGNLEEGDLSIEVDIHSQRIFTLIQNNHFPIFQCGMS